jgi:hypothetical protein
LAFGILPNVWFTKWPSKLKYFGYNLGCKMS